MRKTSLTLLFLFMLLQAFCTNEPGKDKKEDATTEHSQQDKAQVTGDYLRVRFRPTTKAKYIGILYKNMIVTIHGKTDRKVTIGAREDYWYKVKHDNLKGWVFGGFLTFQNIDENHDTYYNSPSMAWFYKKFGHSSWEPAKNINVKSFNLDEYRSLMTAAISNDPPAYKARQTLIITIYTYLKKNPNDPAYEYLKKKLYSKEYLIKFIKYDNESQGGIRDRIINYLPAKIFYDKEFILQIANAGNASTIMMNLPDNLRNDRELIKVLASKNALVLCKAPSKLNSDKSFIESINSTKYCYSIFECISDELKNEREFAKSYLIQCKGIYPLLPEKFRLDKEFALISVKKSPYTTIRMPNHFKDDEEIIKTALDNHKKVKNPEFILKGASKRLQEKFKNYLK